MTLVRIIIFIFSLLVSFGVGSYVGMRCTIAAFTKGKLDGVLAQHNYFKSGSK
jgi:hypothetical protein